jgi:hypothetical protein
MYVSNDSIQQATDAAITLAGGSLTGCPGWGIGRAIVIEPCVQALGGRLRATGRGLTNPNSVTRSWWAVGTLARASAHLGKGFVAELEASIYAPLVRRRFVTTSPERIVADVPAISGAVAFGVSRTF